LFRKLSAQEHKAMADRPQPARDVDSGFLICVNAGYRQKMYLWAEAREK
jgi:hypothetical protein